MKIKKYAETEYLTITHNRFKCFFNLVKQGDYKEAHNFSIPNLIHTKFYSTKLTEKTARTLGGILIEVANILKPSKKEL